MTEISPPPTAAQNGVNGIFSRFWGFDKLIGSTLIKFLYYAGLVGIGVYALIALFGTLAAAQYNAGLALGGILVALAVAIFGTILWRFTCELWLLFFQIYNRLGEIRDRLPPL